MGVNDSSRTRVVPIFDELLARTDATWPRRLVGCVSPSHADFDFGALEDWGWGEDESSLPAPRSLLTHLVTHPGEMRKPGPDFGTSSPTARALRGRLFEADPDTQAAALRLLARPRGLVRGWYVFEGPSRPDVYIQTRNAIIVIEGKRTEKDLTRDTTWMPSRFQLLRHLDAALEATEGRRLIGFYAVEGDAAAPLVVPQAWSTRCKETVTSAVLAGSLPHRDNDKRDAIRQAYAGVVTWQAIMAAFELPESVLLPVGE